MAVLCEDGRLHADDYHHRHYVGGSINDDSVRRLFPSASPDTEEELGAQLRRHDLATFNDQFVVKL